MSDRRPLGYLFTIFLINAFYEKFEDHDKHQLNVCAVIYLGLIGHM